MRIIIDIDTKLTNISKVISDDVDISTILDRATISAREFGKSISEALDAYEEFARQGYKADDLGYLADTGLVASNVGELSSQQASEFVTSAMVQWQIEAEKSMGIIDSWNAISNNYATTVLKLAEGQSKAGATARAMGLDFDQLNAIIGTVTATTKQSGSEIGNFVKAVLPRLVSDKGQDTLAGLGINLTDAEGNIRDVIDIYTEVANAVENISQAEKIAVVEGLAGKYHISRMQALLDDLGRADSMYRSMYETSVNSAGSATEENEKYMASLQARINLLRVEIEELALAIGEAFVTDAFISFLSITGDVIKAVASITSSIGFLPTVLGTASVGMLLLSSRFRNFSNTLIDSIGATNNASNATRTLSVSTENYNRIKKQTGATVPFTTATIRANTTAVQSNTIATNLGTTAAIGFKTALRSLLLASGVGIALAGVGFVIEKIVSVMGNARQRSEELESANKILLESYKNNSSEIDTLSSRYSALEEKIKSTNSNLTDGEWSEYYDVQNKLGQLIPDLVTGEDQYGNKLIVSAEAVRIKTDLLREQLEIENQLQAAKNRQEVDSNIENYNKEIKEAKDNVKDYLATLTNGLSGTASRGLSAEFKVDFKDSNGKPLMKSLDDLEKMMDKVQVKIKEAESKGSSSDVSVLQSQYKQMERYYKMLQDEQTGLLNNTSKLKSEYIKSMTLMIAENKNLSDSAKESASTVSAQILSIANASNIGNVGSGLDAIFDSEKVGTFVKETSKHFEDLGNATYDTFEGISKDVQKYIDNLPDMLSGIADEKEIKAIQSALQAMLTSATNNFNNANDELKKSGKTLNDVTNGLNSLGEEALEASDNFKEFSDALGKTTDNISYINGVLEDYNETGKLSTQTMMDLIGTYPSLIDFIGDEAGMIKELTRLRDEDVTMAKKQLAEKLEASETFYNNNLKILEAYTNEHFKFYKGDLDQFKTLAQAKADIETELINHLAKKWGVYYSSITGDFMPDVSEWTQSSNSFWIPNNDKVSAETQDAINRMNEANKALKDMQSKLDNFALDKVDLDFSKIGTSLDKTTSSTKKNNSTTKESIYITDKYKQQIEELNLAIEKQNKLQSQYPNHTAKYRSALEGELKLQQQKLDLINSQTKALDAQIKSGKIAQTGSVSDPKSATTTVSKSSTVKSGGAWTGRLTSAQGNRVLGGKSEYHRGIDIASPQGSKLIANYAGKIIASGLAGKKGGGAEKYHSSYGNVVVVQDKDGNKHLYAHLEKAIAKLGTTIEKGAQLGTIGSTGRSTGSHLHYEVSNSNGQLQNAASFAKEARNGSLSITQQVNETVKAVDNTQQAIDEAKSTLLSLQGDALAQQEKIAQLTDAIRESTLAESDYKRDVIDSNLSHEVAKLKTLDKESVRYNKTLDLMTKYMQQKQQVNQDELVYIDDLIAKGGLSEIVVAELTARKLELKTAIHDLNAEIQSFKLDNLTKQYEDAIDDINDKIAHQEAKLQHLNTSSERYTQTLRNIAGGYEESSRAVQKHINDLQKLIDTQQVTGDNLDATVDKINDLKVELENLHAQIQDKNYEVVVNIKTQYDDQTDDLQFDIDRSKAIQGMYEEGTANYNNEITKQIDLTKKQMTLYDKSRREIQKEMNQVGLNAEQKKDLMEQMEDLSLSYVNAESSIRSMTKALEDSNKAMLESIADAYINAYKEYVREVSEEHMTALDERAEAEQEAYDKRKQLMDDEMDEFRKNVEEKLRLIRRQEDERTYQRDLDEMEGDRNKLQGKYNELLLDNSYEAKKKREDILEELDEIDKNIAEHKHARDLELQEQALNDLLENKEEEFEIQQEYNDKLYDDTVDRIDREREYWQKYYRDLENDERKFAQIREDILNGHFDKVNAEFESMISQLEATMPRLVDTMDGTMQGVGTAIRQNVIDQLREAMKMVDDYKAKMDEMSSINIGNKFVDDFDPNAGKGDLPTSTSPSEPPSNSNGGGDLIKGVGDIKVVVGKYMMDVLANKETIPHRATTIREKAEALAAEGRAQGSSIPVKQHVNSSLSGFSKQDKENVKDYVYGNVSNILQTDYLQDWMRNWAASLDTGGYLNFKSGSGGLDGKGGKALIAHDGEVMLNKVQTDRLLDNIEVSDGLMNKITSMASMFSNIVSGMSPTLSTGGGYGDITVNFGDVHNATKEQAQGFASEFMNRINTIKGGF